MYKREKYIITPLFIIFVHHGLIYYAFPEFHYLENTSGEGWISYIKYACILLALPVALSSPGYSKSWPAIGFIFLFIPLVPLMIWPDGINPLVLQFQIPIIGYFFAPYAVRLFSDPNRVKRHGLSLLFISLAATSFEYLNGGYFESFSRSGIRATGPFINPNNTGIVVALVASALHFTMTGWRVNLAALFCSSVVIVLTGSKTAAVIYAVGLILSQKTLSRLATIPIASIIIIIYTSGIMDFSINNDLRGFSLESAQIRAKDYYLLINLAYSSSFSEILFGFSSGSLVDNAYIDILSFGGLFTLVFFALSQGWASLLSIRFDLRTVSFLFFLIFLAMLSTNVPRIWPIAYVFWALVGTVTWRSLALVRSTDIKGAAVKDSYRYV